MSDHTLIEAPHGLFSTGMITAPSRWIASIARTWEARRVHRYLATLDDYLLSDIGVTREQIVTWPAARWPWQ